MNADEREARPHGAGATRGMHQDVGEEEELPRLHAFAARLLQQPFAEQQATLFLQGQGAPKAPLHMRHAQHVGVDIDCTAHTATVSAVYAGARGTTHRRRAP